MQREKLKNSVDIVSIFCIAGFSLNIVMGLVMGMLGVYKDFTLYMLLMMANSVIVMLCGSLICAKFCGGMKACIRKYEKKAGFLENFLLVVFGFSGCVTVNFILSIISMFVPFFESGSDMSFFENTDIYSTILALVAIALAPAVCEEIAFRGLAMGNFADFGQGFAILLSSVFFGMMHGTLSGMIFAFTIGCLFGCIRKKSGSLVPSMIVHFLNNAYAVFLIVFMKWVGDKTIYALFTFVFMIVMFVLFVVMMIVTRNKGIFTFSLGNCILSKEERAKIVLTRPLFWVLVMFSAIIGILSMAGTAV